MFTLTGQFNTAKVFTDNIESEAISQIINLCNQQAFSDSQIRIMPDVHVGSSCTVGTTISIKDKIVPRLVGSDIGCGMLVAELGNIDIDLAKFDSIIREYVPAGYYIRKDNHKYVENIHINDLLEVKRRNSNSYNKNLDQTFDILQAEKALGTLGGGNHFIELDKDENDNKYIVIHSGSRKLGQDVAKYHQKLACQDLSMKFGKDKRDQITKELTEANRANEIEAELKKISAIRPINFCNDFAYCEGDLFTNYIHDMKIMQEYAKYNRLAILDEILNHLNISAINIFTTLHNYIDMDNMILRKGAVSAQKGEKLIIPMNMRDGSLICIGKGNSDWNYSAPHGAGRLLNRSEAKELISLEEYKNSMSGIYTTSVNQSTIDESPMAYKPMQEIIENVQDTVEIECIIKPLYNFKAGN